MDNTNGDNLQALRVLGERLADCPWPKLDPRQGWPELEAVSD
jgi:hypothetical protein